MNGIISQIFTKLFGNKKRKYKVIILNQCTVDTDYYNITKIAESFTIKELNNDILYINYIGGLDENNEKFPFFHKYKFNKLYQKPFTNTLILDSKDLIDKKNNYDPRGRKVLLAFEYCIKNFEFDFIYRTSCTCITQVDKLLNAINKLDTKEVYTGQKAGWFIEKDIEENQFYFVISAACLMSKDIVNLILKHKKRYLELTSKDTSVNSYEDVVIGRLLDFELSLPYIKPDKQLNFFVCGEYKIKSNSISIDDIEYIDNVITYRFDPNTLNFVNRHIEQIKENRL